MDLYILRHGDAGPNRSSSAEDNARELTEDGREDVRRMAERLLGAGLLAPSIIFASPLIRARQTAEIVKQVWRGSGDITTTQSLVSGDILRMMSEVAAQYPVHHAVLLAGHEPSLSAFACAVLAGSERSFIELDKAGLIHISVYQPDPVRMRGFLRMYLAPHHLAVAPQAG
ncbi:MAG TPA: histidine phosphatase family protein [Candidatus Kapabacteria bacterium]|nr:histidine phosphatase family protein [Candidatus Kapabacteria bacterium]